MIVGRITKDSTDVRRVTVDFSLWLDPSETLVGFTTPVFNIELVQPNSDWPTSPPPPPVDTNPPGLQFAGITDNGIQLQMLVTSGTPGLTYRITSAVVGSTSGRVKTVDVMLSIRTVS